MPAFCVFVMNKNFPIKNYSMMKLQFFILFIELVLNMLATSSLEEWNNS